MRFESEVNSGRIFTAPQSGSVNFLPPFTNIEKNNIKGFYNNYNYFNINAQLNK